ncbi:MAG: hypothetical protein IPN19_15080 [Elusimicrobia bacterium]|nr:hypothetical protein [Elusimicrobiota bacterium]
MKDLYYNFDHMYGVYFDEVTKRYFIEVECGDIALYGVRVLLNEKEVSMFKEKNDSLNDLAFAITRDPEKYKRDRFD